LGAVGKKSACRREKKTCKNKTKETRLKGGMRKRPTKICTAMAALR